jgi:hypothetical protein
VGRKSGAQNAAELGARTATIPTTRTTWIATATRRKIQLPIPPLSRQPFAKRLATLAARYGLPATRLHRAWRRAIDRRRRQCQSGAANEDGDDYG